jgi:hypothetical protein
MDKEVKKLIDEYEEILDLVDKLREDTTEEKIEKYKRYFPDFIEPNGSIEFLLKGDKS